MSIFQWVGEGAAGHVTPYFQNWGGAQIGLSPHTVGQRKCSNFTIFSYFVVKFSKFSWLASLAKFTVVFLDFVCILTLLTILSPLQQKLTTGAHPMTVAPLVIEKDRLYNEVCA